MSAVPTLAANTTVKRWAPHEHTTPVQYCFDDMVTFPLYDASAAGDAARVQELIAGATPAVNQAREPHAEPSIHDRETPLMVACRNGHDDCVRLLLGVGADVEQRKKNSVTALLIACQNGHLDCARLLLEAGAAVDQATADGCTPLLVACRNGRLDCARLLFEAGAAVDQARADGCTPLLMACRRGHLDCARLLLEAGAAVDQATADGCTPLLVACQQGHLDCARLLLEAGTAVDQATADGCTPLFMACCKAHLDCARLLLEAGAAVDQARADGCTPLLMACQEGHAKCAHLLCSHGASRTFGNDDTAESIAAEEGHEELCSWLEQSRGWTPLHHLEVLGLARTRALLRAGADVHARPVGAGTLTPVERAAAMAEPRVAAAELVLCAAEPWSPQNHQLFPAAARARAVTLLFLGCWFANQTRFAGEEQAMKDVWVDCVMAHSVRRAG